MRHIMFPTNTKKLLVIHVEDDPTIAMAVVGCLNSIMPPEAGQLSYELIPLISLAAVTKYLKLHPEEQISPIPTLLIFDHELGDGISTDIIEPLSKKFPNRFCVSLSSIPKEAIKAKHKTANEAIMASHGTNPAIRIDKYLEKTSGWIPQLKVIIQRMISSTPKHHQPHQHHHHHPKGGTTGTPAATTPSSTAEATAVEVTRGAGASSPSLPRGSSFFPPATATQLPEATSPATLGAMPNTIFAAATSTKAATSAKLALLGVIRESVEPSLPSATGGSSYLGPAFETTGGDSALLPPVATSPAISVASLATPSITDFALPPAMPSAPVTPAPTPTVPVTPGPATPTPTLLTSLPA